MNQDIEQGKLVIQDLLINYYFTAVKKPVETLIFLHGWRSNSTLWFKTFPELYKDNYQIYAVDLPGFGLSQTPSKPLYLEDYMISIVEFMKKLEIESPIIIGHSHGGRVGIKLASMHPELLNKLVLVDSGGVRRESADLQLKKAMAKLVKPLFKLPFMKNLREKVYTAMGAEDYVATPELTKTFVNIIKEDLVPLLPTIKAQTLLIWGKEDTATPLEDAEVMKEKIPFSTLEIIDNAGHYSFFDKPDEFAKLLIKFIRI